MLVLLTVKQTETFTPFVDEFGFNLSNQRHMERF